MKSEHTQQEEAELLPFGAVAGDAVEAELLLLEGVGCCFLS